MAKKSPAVRFADDDVQIGTLLDLYGGKKRAEEDSAWLVELCRYHRIQEGPLAFYDLALVLARKLYPRPKKRGVKPKWTRLIKSFLVVEVERRAKQDLISNETPPAHVAS